MQSHRGVPQASPGRAPGQLSQEELSQLARARGEFTRQAQRSCRVVRFGMLLFFTGVAVVIANGIVTIPLAWNSSPGLAAGLIMAASGIVSTLFGFRVFTRLRCPICREVLAKCFGPFCRRCGSRSLHESDDYGPARCTSCGGAWRGADTVDSDLRFCTHCGSLMVEGDCPTPPRA